MRQGRKAILISLFITLLLSFGVLPLYGQTEEENVVTFAPGEYIGIGVATDLSNVLRGPGLDIAQSIRLAVIQYNEAGGLYGFELEAMIEDDLCTAEPAVEVAERFAQTPSVVAVVGHICSGASIPASEVYQEARIPMVSPASTAGLFTARGLDVVNRTVFNDNIQGVVGARYIYEVLGAETLAILHNGTPYGEGLAETVERTFEGEVLFFEAIDPTTGDYRDLIGALDELNPNVIYFGGYTDEAAVLIEQMREGPLPDTPFFSSDGIYGSDFLIASAEFSEGVYATFGRQTGSPGGLAAFLTAYESTYGITPEDLGTYYAQAYDATQMIILALEKVATLDEDGNLSIDREALIQTIRETRRYRGLSGIITCDENGDCGQANIAVFQVIDGTWIEQLVPDDLQVTGRG